MKQATLRESPGRAACDHTSDCQRQRRTTLHPAWTYTLHDLAGALWGVFVFAAAVGAPGYCLGYLMDFAAFRTRALREQLAWSVALSFGPGVLVLVAAVGLGGAAGGAWLLAAFTGIALWLFLRHPPFRDFTRRQGGLALAVFAAWTALVVGSLLDVGLHHRLWLSVTSYDHGLRTAFVDAVLRTGLSPVDPVYWPGHDVPMRYYYFWYAVCAAVARLGHISGRAALMASCVWPVAGVVAMLALFGRYVLGRRGRELTRLLITASSLLPVAGLDILVIIALHLLHTPVFADMEWWSMDQVASWPDTFLWVPHHAAALVAALLGLLLLLLAAGTERLRPRLTLAAMAGLSFAAAFGMSAYIGVAAAIVAGGSMLASLRGSAVWRSVQSVLLAAVVSGLALGRFLFQISRHEGASTRSTSPLSPGMREILDPGMLAGSPLLHSIARQHPWRAREIAAALLLLPGWAVELGFFAVVLAVALFRRRRSSPGERTILTLALSGLVAASVVRSGVISTNDYGVRAALLPQFFLLLVGAAMFNASTAGFRRFLSALLVIGSAGCAYQLVLLRTYLPWQETHGNADVQQAGERTYALREAYAALQGRVPPAARIQFDPASTGFFLYPHLLYAGRQVVTAEITCSTSFGGDPAACPLIQSGLLQLFPAAPGAVPDARHAEKLCAAIGAQYLVVTRWDKAWSARSGWVWTLPAVVGQPSVRIVSCQPAI